MEKIKTDPAGSAPAVARMVAGFLQNVFNEYECSLVYKDGKVYLFSEERKAIIGSTIIQEVKDGENLDTPRPGDR